MNVDSVTINDQPAAKNASGNAEAMGVIANENELTKPAISPIRMPTTEDNVTEHVETYPNADGQTELCVTTEEQLAAAPASPVPDQPEQLADLFRDARYFMVKSSNYENVSLAKVKGVWATPPPNEHRLNGAYHNSRSVYLIFSVKESGRFQGYARLAGPSEKSGSRDRVNWVLPPGLSHRALSGTFRIDWISRRELRFGKTGHLLNAWNEFKPVKIGRDGQEIEPGVGEALCRLFHVDPECDLDRLVERTKSRRRVNVPSGPPQHHNPHHHYQHQPPPLLPPMPPSPQQFMQLDQQQQYHQQVPPPPIPLHQQQQQRAPSRDRNRDRDRERDRERDRRRDHREHREQAPSWSSSSRRRRLSSGRRSSSRRQSRSPAAHRSRGGDRHGSSGRDRRRSGSRNRDRSHDGNGANGSSNFQGVGKETFINGSYQDYLKQFGSAAVGQPEQASQPQQQQQQQPYQQYATAYGYQYAAAANPYAMMYGQQYMMPGQQHAMYAYPQQQQYIQQLQYQQQLQQQQQQQQVQPELSMKDYEQRVNEFIQRTTNAVPASTAAASAEAAGSRNDASSSSSGEEASGGGGGEATSRHRRRRRSSSSSSSGR